MKPALVLASALVFFGGARLARMKVATRDSGDAEEPYTPSPQAAPFVSLGYREAMADVLYVRLRLYLGTYYGTTSEGIIGLGQAITTLDPRFHRAYEISANGTTMAERGVEQRSLHRALDVLDAGMKEFPDDWELPYLAGQIYIQDLKTDDKAERRAWDEKGTLLVESSLRKPGASLKAAEWAAFLRTKLGQQQRAIDSLRELILLTDGEARQHLIEQLEKLTKGDESLVSEVVEMRKKFEKQYRAERPLVSANMYLLIGPRIKPGFDMTDLATGGRDIVGSQETEEPLEPLE